MHMHDCVAVDMQYRNINVWPDILYITMHTLEINAAPTLYPFPHKANVTPIFC